MDPNTKVVGINIGVKAPRMYGNGQLHRRVANVMEMRIIARQGNDLFLDILSFVYLKPSSSPTDQDHHHDDYFPYIDRHIHLHR